jgi:autotransporter-associated beta strand protein
MALGVALCLTPVAIGQVATLGKGHQLLLNKGLQIWGLDQGAVGFNYNNLANANFNGVMWSFGIDEDNAKLASMSPGQKWGKWLDANGTPANALDAFETSRIADLVALQVGDEQQLDLENPNGVTKAWFQAAHAGNHFPNQLKYVNSFFINSDAAYATFIAEANPDAISFDSYPFDDPYGSVILPNNWLALAGRFRRHALSSYLGIGGNAPRPYGMYLQTYAGNEGPGRATRHPGEVEMRWQQFTAWTMGFTFVDAFTVGGSSSLFSGSNMSSPTEPRYSQFAETSRQSLNLGPALTRLISYGYGPSIVLGKDANGNTNPMIADWLPFNKTNAPPNQQYLTNVSATNIGTKNNGQPGDVYIGFFNPLHASFGDPAGTAYFMVMNALGPYLNDDTATVVDCMQQITLDFDFGATTINSLQRLSRDTGQVEVVPLTHVSDNKYRLVFNLEGGTGDLFKFNDGTPFVGLQAPATTLYWDPDGNAGNNNLATGAGLGGGGAWDNGGNDWYNGSTNASWAAGSNATFLGAAGTVTLSAPQSASGLHFKTNGYNVSGATLTLSGPFVTVDAGATATIGSVVSGSAGLVKNGAGTLNLTANNTYSGGTTINEGVLGIVSGSLGSVPGSPAVNVAINNGATLRFNQNNLTLSSNRSMVLGGGAGGTVDTNGNNNGIAGTVSGGILVKAGAGTLTLSGTNSHAGTRIKAGAVLVTGDANLGAAPATFAAGNITLDGGTLRFGADFNINNNRGITIEAAGGTIDTQGFSNPAGYNAFQGGFRGPGDLTKIGSGTFFAATPTAGFNSNWKGRLIIKEGTWKIVGSDGLPYNIPTQDGLKPDQVTLDGGTWQIGATISVTNGRRGVTIASGGGTIDTQNFNFTWAGPWAGSDPNAVLNKIGNGILRLNSNATHGPGTYAGIVNVNGGVLQLDGGTAMGDLASINLGGTVGVALNITTAAETIGSLAGGGGSPGGGNVTLSASLLTGGNDKSTTFNGAISGPGGLTKNGSGTFTLAPAFNGNSYTGGTTVNGGKLLVNNAIGSGTGSGAVTVNSGATLGGAGAISGAVTIHSGGHVAPGTSIESLDVGSLTLAAGSILDFELDTVASTDTSDMINVTTANGLTINGGTLNLTDVGGMTPGTYTLIDYSGTLNGNVSNLVLGAAPSGFVFALANNQANTTIDLVVSAAGLAGDFNNDGSVDAADYVIWRKGLGTTHTQQDYDAWQANFGALAGGGAASAVPEPATLVGLVSALLILFSRRRSYAGSTAPQSSSSPLSTIR